MRRVRGFTLIEIMTALLVLSLLALMSYRGLSAVLDARAQVRQETEKWGRVAAFLARFERDVQLAAPRATRTAEGDAPAWLGVRPDAKTVRLEFSRFASTTDVDAPRRVGYRLNEDKEIELWLWPALDIAADTPVARYTVLTEVEAFELQYLNGALAWVDTWPISSLGMEIPLAVRIRLVLSSKEEIVRIFALQS
jgi:general secretion pathway protein J